VRSADNRQRAGELARADDPLPVQAQVAAARERHLVGAADDAVAGELEQVRIQPQRSVAGGNAVRDLLRRDVVRAELHVRRFEVRIGAVRDLDHRRIEDDCPAQREVDAGIEL
jgi:hypothetical protein